MAVQDLGDTDGWTAEPVDHNPFADGSDSDDQRRSGFSGHIAATSDPEHPLTARSLPFAAGQQASISPFTPSPGERLQYGASELAQSYGVPVQGAERIGQAARFGAEATPGLGQFLSGAEMVHSAQQRDPVGTIAGGLGAVPSLGMLIGPTARTWSKAAQAEAERMLAAGAKPDDVYAATKLFQNPLGQWQKEIPDTSAFYTEKPGRGHTLGSVLYHPEAYDAYPGLKDIPVEYWPPGQEGGLRGSFWADRQGRGSVATPPGSMALKRSLGSPSVPLHETGHAIQTIEGWPMGGTPKRPYESNPNYPIWENFQRKNLDKLMTDPPQNSDEWNRFMGYEDRSAADLEFPDFWRAYMASQRVGKPVPSLEYYANRRSNYDYYRSHYGEAEARNIQNRWLDAKVEGGYGALEPFYKTFDTNYFSYPQYAEGGRVGFQGGGGLESEEERLQQQREGIAPDDGGLGGVHAIGMPTPNVIGGARPVQPPMPGRSGAADASEPAPRDLNPSGFYSHGAEMANTLPQQVGTTEQMVAQLGKRGVKPVEMEGAGLDSDSLSMLSGMVTRDQLADLFQRNMPNLQETTLGKQTVSDEDALTEARRFSASIGEDWDRVPIRYQRRYIEAARDQLAGNQPRSAQPKYAEYTLPGGENYREVLLHMGIEPPEIAAARAKHQMYADMDREMTPEESEDYDRNLALLQQHRNPYLNQDGAGIFESSHWDQPNVVAHLRMSDRPGPNGEKLLHLEELQSDWGQGAREAGIKLPHDEYMRRGSALIREAATASPERQAEITDEMNRAHDAQTYGVPSGPFIGSTQGWTDLGLKRALIEAARGGYDGMIWTPGEEQAKRWPDPANAEGLKGYYDNIVPKRLAVITKKLDPSAKIGQIGIGGAGYEIGRVPDGWTLHDGTGRLLSVHDSHADAAAAGARLPGQKVFPHLPITPLMREQILKGLPQYRRGGRVGFQGGGAALNRVNVRTSSGTFSFQVEIAADDASRTQGLKGRESLAADRGMLFLFDDEAPRTFNMQNVRIPLDIIFISSQGRVTRIARAAPQAKHPIPSGRASMAVLELKGGTAARIGLKVGDRVEAGDRAGFQAGGGVRLEAVEGNPFGEIAPGVTAGLSAREVPDRTMQPSDLARAKGFPEPRSPMHDRIAAASRDDDVPYTPEDIDQPGPMTETLAHYAGNPEHAMPMRIGAAIGEEAKEKAQGLWSLATVPGDVASGKTTMEDPETQQRVIGLAASLPGGGAEEALGARGPVGSAAKAARVRALRKQAPEATTTYEPPWAGEPAATTTEAPAAAPGAGSNAPRTVWNPTTGKWEGAKPTASLPEGVTYPPLFNFDKSVMNAVPDVPQFPLQRYDPPKGVSARMRDLITNPDVRRQMIEIVKNGMNTVGLSWYNTGQLRAAFLKELGDTEGQQAFEKYMNLVSATSPENKIPQNIRTASYFYEREHAGEPPPERGDPIAQPYGSKAQKLHQQNVNNVLTNGYDVLKNPKPPSFVQNLMGNYEPGTMDRHAFKLPAMLSRDPRFLETSFTPEKGAKPVRPQQMFKNGQLTIDDAVKQPTMWAGMPNKNEYAALEGWYKSIADELGITPAQVQASAWVGGGKITGLASASDETFLHSFQGRVFNTAYNTGLTPAEVMRRFIRGEQPLLAGGPGMPPLLQQEDQDRARKEAQTSTAGAAAPPP